LAKIGSGSASNGVSGDPILPRLLRHGKDCGAGIISLHALPLRHSHYRYRMV
jgi:hypothetical protein